MTTRCLLSLAFLAVASTLCGQEARTLNELSADIRRLDTLIRTLEGKLESNSKRLDTQVGVLEKQKEVASGNLKILDDLNTRLFELEGQFGSLSSRVNTLESRLSKEVAEQLATQKQILDAISRKDSSGAFVPQLSAIMNNSSDFKADLSNAVHQVLKPQGKVIIANKTSTPQMIKVNGQDYTVPAGQTEFTVGVNVGTVTTQIPGREFVNWTVAAPSYVQYIDIVPAPVANTLQTIPYVYPFGY